MESISLIPDFSFSTLRAAQKQRLPMFINSKGKPAHEKDDGSDWSLNDWFTAVADEVGEAGNILKKLRRGDMTIEEARPLLAKEYADIICYLDILADQTGINLANAVIEKFNEVSERIGANIIIENNEWKYTNIEWIEFDTERYLTVGLINSIPVKLIKINRSNYQFINMFGIIDHRFDYDIKGLNMLFKFQGEKFKTFLIDEKEQAIQWLLNYGNKKNETR